MKKNLFNPKTIAIIGATDHKDKVGYGLMKNLLGFKGKILPINPNRDNVFNLKTYKNVLDYSGKIDLAIIAIPSDYVSKALIECGKKKIKNIIVVSAGFSEVGNIKGEQEIDQIIEKYKMNLLGPNCLGLSNPYNSLHANFARTKAKRGSTAFISQSGALYSYLSDLGIGISCFASLGNPGGLDFEDFLDYFNKDKKTKRIIMYIEKLTNGREFIKIAKKINKKIYVIKVGKSEEGKKAAISHTGSLASDYEIYKGAFKQAGVRLCDSLEEAIGIKTRKQKIKFSKKVDIITNAGGASAIMADYLSKKNISSEIEDIYGAALSEDYKKALEKREDNKRDIIVILTPQTMTEIDKTAQVIIDFKKHFKKKIICFFLGGKSVAYAMKLFKKNRIISFNRLNIF